MKALAVDASLARYVPFAAPAGAPRWKRWLVLSPSVVAVALSLLASLALATVALRRGTFVQPWWNRAAADNGSARQEEGPPC